MWLSQKTVSPKRFSVSLACSLVSSVWTILLFLSYWDWQFICPRLPDTKGRQGKSSHFLAAFCPCLLSHPPPYLSSVPMGELASHKIFSPSWVPVDCTVNAHESQTPKAETCRAGTLTVIMTMLRHPRAIHSFPQPLLSNC